MSKLPATAISTDLYELAMMAGFVAGRDERAVATFELSVRRLPRNRNYLVAAGLEQALDYLESLRFAGDDIDWLRNLPAMAQVNPAFFEYLRGFRFTGDVWAVAEGTPVFPQEPLLRVTAPLPEAQLVETALLSILSHQTTVASKAARIVHAAAGREVLEFGARRAHGPGAALCRARAAYLAGCEATSYVEAGRRFGIPLSGTMAHSWVLAARDEMRAFERYTEIFGDRAALLIDTYDTVRAAAAIAASALRPSAVRIDSGDLGALARQVRAVFDAHGLRETRILLSGDLDEQRIQRLILDGVPVDGFGVGTSLVTSDDAPALSAVYKLVEVREGDRARRLMKRSPGKMTWPGAKQVWRVDADRADRVDADRADRADGRVPGPPGHRRAVRDVIALADEPALEGAEPLLEQVVAGGRRLAPSPSLALVRSRHKERLRALPPALLGLSVASPFPVRPSAALGSLIASGTSPGAPR